MNKTKLPTEAQVKNLHKKYAKTDADFALIYTHCQVIDAIAVQLLDAKPNSQIDRDLLHVACMLHDIGAYDVLENGKFVDGVRHGVIGEKILRNEGFPEQIWRFASHHTGVGLTKQDVIATNLSRSSFICSLSLAEIRISRIFLPSKPSTAVLPT